MTNVSDNVKVSLVMVAIVNFLMKSYELFVLGIKREISRHFSSLKYLGEK